MNTMAAKQLAWKERSLLTPLTFGALLLFWVLAIVIGVVSSYGNSSSRTIAGSMTTLYIVISVIHGLACGVFMFAPEREAGTDRFLDQLPISSRAIGNAKFLWSSANVLVFNLATILSGCLVFYWIRGEWMTDVVPRDQSIFLAAAMAFLLPVTTYLWSLLSSRLLSSPLHATFLAALLTGAGSILCLILAGTIGDMAHPNSFAIVNGVLVVLLAILNLKLSQTWLRPAENMSNVSPQGPQGRLQANTGSSKLGGKSYAIDKADRKQRAYRVLCWQSIRYFRFPVLVVVIGSALFWALFSVGGSAVSHYANFLFAGFAGGYVGMSTFLGDQRNGNYLFFREQGVNARQVWWVRMQFVALCSLIILPVSFFTFSTVHSRLVAEQQNYVAHYSLLIQSNISLVALVMTYLICLGSGQFCSLMIRSPIFLFASVLLVCPVLGWWAWCVGFLGASSLDRVGLNILYPSLFVGPLVACLFWATWWFAPGWMTGLRSFRGRVVSNGAVLLVAGLCFTGLVFDRVTEFDAGDWKKNLAAQKADFKAIESNNPAEKYAAALFFKKALSHFVPATELSKTWDESLDDKEWNPESLTRYWPNEVLDLFVAENQTSIHWLKEGLALPNSVYAFRPLGPETEARQLSLLACASTERLIRAGKKDAALESLLLQLRGLRHFVRTAGQVGFSDLSSQLVRWGEMEGQNKTSLLNGLKKLDESWAEVVKMNDPFTNLVVSRFEEWMIDYRAGVADRDFENFNQLTAFSFPWEVTRSEAYMLANASFQQRKLDLLKAEANVPGSYLRSAAVRENNFYFEAPWYSNPQRTLSLFDYGIRFRERSKELAHEIQLYRYVKIRWALAAFYADMGRYPEALLDLSPRYIDRVPADYFGGGMFYYAKDGLELPAVFSWQVEAPDGTRRRFQLNRLSSGYTSQWGRLVTNFSIAKNTPFLLPVAARRYGVVHWWLPKVRAKEVADDAPESQQPKGKGVLLVNPVLDKLEWYSDIKLKCD